MRITAERMRDIAKYAKNHTMSETISMFNCKHKTVRKALLIQDIEDSVTDVDSEMRVKKAVGWPKPKAGWKPPSMAAPQCECFIGRPI